MDPALGLRCFRGFDGDNFGFGTKRGRKLIQGGGLDIRLIILIGRNKELSVAVGALP